MKISDLFIIHIYIRKINICVCIHKYWRFICTSSFLIFFCIFWHFLLHNYFWSDIFLFPPFEIDEFFKKNWFFVFEGGFLQIFIEKTIGIPNSMFLKLLVFSFISGRASATAATFFLNREKFNAIFCSKLYGLLCETYRTKSVMSLS